MLLVISGCRKDIFIEIPEQEPKIVLSALIEQDSTFKVYVSKSRNTGKKEALLYLQTATVDVFKNDNYEETLEIEKYISPVDTIYFYPSSVRATAGDKITIKASSKDLKDVEGTTEIPKAVEITSLELKEVINEDGLFVRTANMEISFKDPSETKNYYHIKVYTVYEPPYLSTLGYSTNDVNAIDAAYSEVLFDNSFLWDDLYFSGLEKKINISFSPQPIDATYKIELRTISKEYFQFYRTLYLQQQNSSGPFAEPINIFSNIKNGYGIVAGYSAVSDTIFIPE